jgi:lysophospholipase L1-like esterase
MMTSGSRWSKIDGNSHRLLDSTGHVSAFGPAGQEPSCIVINYGTNDVLGNANPSDLQASVTQCLGALRAAAPRASIFVIVPFGQYGAGPLKAGVAAYRASHSGDPMVSIIDLGTPVAKALQANGYWSGLHPNMRGHATFASEILAAILSKSAGPGECRFFPP